VIGDPFEALAPEQRALLREAPRPDWVEPMKATLTGARFSDPNWIFERKLDGIRCVAVRGDDGVRLLSRNDLSLDGRFPELVTHLVEHETGSWVIDGEVVAFAGSATSFGRLTERHRGRPVPVFYYVFDVLWLQGRDTTALPQRARKALLRRTLAFRGSVRYTPHRNRDGEAFYSEACASDWEGLIAKRADAPYRSGRSRDWLKLKCDAEQELVVGGFTAPQGSREVLGALLVGHYEDGALRYAGKVGTGFTHDTLRRLASRLHPVEASPFADPVREPRVTWVAPELVAQIGFSEWTRDGRLRHPRFLGLRDDKPAREVVREVPA